jgi:hypothetical protein
MSGSVTLKINQESTPNCDQKKSQLPETLLYREHSGADERRGKVGKTKAEEQFRWA